MLSAGKRIRFPLQNCGVGSEANRGLAAKFVLSTANHVFDAELCCPHGIKCSVLNCILRSESGVRCRILMSTANQLLAAKFVLSATKQVFAVE